MQEQVKTCIRVLESCQQQRTNSSYAVLVLFGVIPGAMAWSERYSSNGTLPTTKNIVPGGKATLVLVIGGAGAIIGGEILELALSLR